MTETARVSTGVPGLDAMIDGGFPPHRAVLIRGQIGTGKTTMATQFLVDGIRQGQPGVLVSVDSKPRHVVEDAARFGWDLQDASARRMLAVLDASPYFTATRKNALIDPRQVASDLTQQVRTLGATRLVIDSLTSLLPPEGPRTALRDFLRSLLFSLEDNVGCTVVLTAWDSRDEPSQVGNYAEYLASGVLELKLVPVRDRLERRLLVRKMRGTPTDLSERPFQIVADRGVVLDGHR
jgi:KaiC/GvpD/RAD55 family RecA-like ATPase